VADVVDDHFPAIIQSQTVNGRIIALPMFTDAPALYYRTIFWRRRVRAALDLGRADRDGTGRLMPSGARDNGGIYGFVWQGAAYEG
jgi:trehalose/maltose transport system substrate-binding protein